MSLSDNLKRIRKERHISQEELAEELNVSRQAISKWEQGSCLPEVKMLLLISKKLDVSLDNLMSASSDEGDTVSRQIADKGIPCQAKRRRTVFFAAASFLVICLCFFLILLKPQTEIGTVNSDPGVVESPLLEGNANRGITANADASHTENGVFTTKEDRESIFALSCEFAEAYFAQDFDSISSFLATDFIGDPKDISPWEGIGPYTIKGVDSISTEKANGIKVISVEFRNPEYPDSYLYLTIEFVKQNDDWKVRAYYLEA